MSNAGAHTKIYQDSGNSANETALPSYFAMVCLSTTVFAVSWNREECERTEKIGKYINPVNKRFV